VGKVSVSLHHTQRGDSWGVAKIEQKNFQKSDASVSRETETERDLRRQKDGEKKTRVSLRLQCEVGRKFTSTIKLGGKIQCLPSKGRGS